MRKRNLHSNPRFSAAGFEWKKNTPVYHATTGLRSILQGGIKSREQIIKETGVKFEAAGGIHGHSISFTIDANLASSILVTIWNMAHIARNEITMAQLLTRLQLEYPSIFETLMTASFVSVDKYAENIDKIDAGWERSWLGDRWEWTPPRNGVDYKQLADRKLEVYKEAARMGRDEVDWPIIFAGSTFLSKLQDTDLAVLSAKLNLDWILPSDRESAIQSGALRPEHFHEYETWGRTQTERMWDLARSQTPWQTSRLPWDDRDLGGYANYQRFSPPYLELVEGVTPTLSNTGEYYSSEAEVRIFDSRVVRDLQVYETIYDVLRRLPRRSSLPPLFHPRIGAYKQLKLSD